MLNVPVNSFSVMLGRMYTYVKRVIKHDFSVYMFNSNFGDKTARFKSYWFWRKEIKKSIDPFPRNAHMHMQQMYHIRNFWPIKLEKPIKANDLTNHTALLYHKKYISYQNHSSNPPVYSIIPIYFHNYCKKYGGQYRSCAKAGPDSLVGRASASGAVDPGLAPRSRHTKSVQNGTTCSSSLADARIKKGSARR